MRKKLLSVFILTALPVLAYAADINVRNNTDSYGTGHFNSFLKICSSTLGDKGVMKPKQQNFVIAGSSIKTACGSKDCEAFIYDSPNCKGQKTATVVINASTGIVNITNHAPDRFKIVEHSAINVEVNPPDQKGFKAWFKSFF